MTLYLLIPVVVGLLAGSLYAIWKAHEEAKSERTLQRIQSACSESKPRAAGLASQSRKVS